MNRVRMLTIGTLLLALTFLMSTPPASAQAVIGPKLEVTTIPQGDQLRGTGVMVLGLEPNIESGPDAWPYPDQDGSNLVTSYKISVTFNGLPVFWDDRSPSSAVKLVCAVLLKTVTSPTLIQKGSLGWTTTAQFPQEVLKTRLTDVSEFYVCKPRWTVVAPHILLSTGVVDMYYFGSDLAANNIGDNIVTFEAFLTVGTTTVVGSDIQDLCLLGWAMGFAAIPVTLVGGSIYTIFYNPIAPFSSCDYAALAQRSSLGIPIPLA